MPVLAPPIRPRTSFYREKSCLAKPGNIAQYRSRVPSPPLVTTQGMCIGEERGGEARRRGGEGGGGQGRGGEGGKGRQAREGGGDARRCPCQIDEIAGLTVPNVRDFISTRRNINHRQNFSSHSPATKPKKQCSYQYNVGTTQLNPHMQGLLGY